MIRSETAVVVDNSKHALAKNIHCIDPMAIVQCNEWGKWIIDESVRRFVKPYTALLYEPQIKG
jgi:hypothetical protein